ncbi:Dabb family protein [Rhodococcus sp. JS3073]|uniref:Dabb family protein n=1 Tax=Rhodococcus sp. JS3073 TaxID=3002901 RepID=UPI003FA72A0F
MDEFQTDFKFFGDQIPYARNVRHGTDLGKRPNNASCALVPHFQDEADFQQYLDHPLHKELIQSTIVPKCESWLGDPIPDSRVTITQYLNPHGLRSSRDAYLPTHSILDRASVSRGTSLA